MCRFARKVRRKRDDRFATMPPDPHPGDDVTARDHRNGLLQAAAPHQQACLEEVAVARSDVRRDLLLAIVEEADGQLSVNARGRRARQWKRTAVSRLAASCVERRARRTASPPRPTDAASRCVRRYVGRRRGTGALRNDSNVEHSNTSRGTGMTASVCSSPGCSTSTWPRPHHCQPQPRKTENKPAAQLSPDGRQSGWTLSGTPVGTGFETGQRAKATAAPTSELRTFLARGTHR